MKSLVILWKMLAEESASRCCTDATMDLKKVHLRVKCEGLSFLTITLPRFGEDFQTGLDQGLVDRRLFFGFQRKGELPLFLGGFLDLIFDRITGVLLENPSVDAILAVRQLSLMFSKIALPCSDARNYKAIQGYLQCEKDVVSFDHVRLPSLEDDFHRVSSLLFASVFSAVDRQVYAGEIRPKHGPGATADFLRGNGKFRQSEWTERLESIFPYGEFALPSWSYFDQLDAINILEPGAERPVRVISVPKTLKAPRIIAIEPTCMQYVQQGLMEAFLAALNGETPFTDVSHIRGMLGFVDQETNQLLAKYGSSSGRLATIDLSEASDRVSNRLVSRMLQNHPFLFQGVMACRSSHAMHSDFGVIPLSKFASMGSALTFPIEAMVFLTVIFLGIERELNTQMTKKTVRSFLGQVRVYGDDLIVPVPYVRSVISELEAFGLKVNERKSFWNGKFRESCGREYYDGFDVSVVKVRRAFPTSRRHVQEVISLVSLRNQLYWAGYWDTCKWLDGEIRKIIHYFPVVLPESPVLGRQSVLGYETQRLCPYLHTPQVRGWRVSSQLPSDPLAGSGALLKFFLKRSSLPTVDRKHLERAGRPHAVNIKLGWAPST